MTEHQYAKLDIAAHWGRMNDTILDLVDVIPDDKINWSPRGDLWNFRGILAHLVATRHSWLERTDDGEETPHVYGSIGTKDGIKDQLRLSWERMERFLSDQTGVDRVYKGTREGRDYSISGNWAAFHLLEHDIHHRADMFQYLNLLGIEHPEVATP